MTDVAGHRAGVRESNSVLDIIMHTSAGRISCSQWRNASYEEHVTLSPRKLFLTSCMWGTQDINEEGFDPHIIFSGGLQ